MKNTKEMDRLEIMLLAKILPDVSGKTMSLVLNAFPYTNAFRRTGKRAEQNDTYWCGHCGESFNLPDLTDLHPNPEYNPKDYWYYNVPKRIATCPHCGKTMYIRDYAEKAVHFQDIIGIRTTFGDWQVNRYYDLHNYRKRGEEERVVVQKIGAEWSRDGRTYYYIAERGGMFYSKYWKVGGKMRFANEFPEYVNWRGGECEEHFEVPSDFSIMPILERRGIDPHNMHGMKLTSLLPLMDEHPAVETLWKAGEYNMVKELKGDIELLWAQIKIIRRQGYKPENCKEWADMVWLLRDLGLDDHSPKYLCPKDLHAYHQYLLERKRKEQDETQLRNALRQEAVFVQRRKPYFGLSIPSEKGFTIVCLQSIKEFKHEGDVLQHCVFHCSYYNRPNSLILSARDSENNPIETLEIDLQDFIIRQCYGFQDKHTELHDEITKTMQENMWQVKAIAQGATRIAC